MAIQCSLASYLFPSYIANIILIPLVQVHEFVTYAGQEIGQDLDEHSWGEGHDPWEFHPLPIPSGQVQYPIPHVIITNPITHVIITNTIPVSVVYS